MGKRKLERAEQNLLLEPLRKAKKAKRRPSKDEGEQDEADEIAVPPVELKTVIDQTSEFIAQNGKEYEDIIRQQDNADFDFLDQGTLYNAYYEQKLSEALIGGCEKKKKKKKNEADPKKQKEEKLKKKAPTEGDATEGPKKKKKKEAKAKKEKVIEPKLPTEATLIGVCSGGQIILKMIADKLEEGKGPLRVELRGPHFIASFADAEHATQAAKSLKGLELEGIGCPLKVLRHPKEVFAKTSVSKILKAVLERAVGKLASINLHEGQERVTLNFAHKEDADQALNEGTVQLMEGIKMQLEEPQNCTAARLWVDAKMLLHNVVAEAIPQLVKVFPSPSMQSAMLWVAGEDATDALLDAEKLRIGGTKVRIQAAKTALNNTNLGDTGEFE